MFLTPDDIVTLTGRRNKSLQCEQLRIMGIPFHVNANGHPVVARLAIEGRTFSEQPKATGWTPKPFRV